jgi:glycine dehydrogenase subunit 1
VIAGTVEKKKAADAEAANCDKKLEDLKKKLTDKTAAVYIENPSYLGFLEEGVDEISALAHKNESMLIVGVIPARRSGSRPSISMGTSSC